MGKKASDSVLDALLDKIGTATTAHVVDAEPADRAAAIANSLADVTLAGGDFSKADGTPNGRELTVAQKTGITVDATGNANHVAFIDGTELLAVTTVTTQALTVGNTMTLNSFNFRVADPV